MASLHKEKLFPATALTDSANGNAFAMNMFQKSFIAVIHATSVNAATTIAAKIQHSDDNVNWYDLVAFTNIVGAAGHEAKAITSAVLPYTRASITLSGTTKAATVEINLHSDK